MEIEVIWSGTYQSHEYIIRLKSHGVGPNNIIRSPTFRTFSTMITSYETTLKREESPAVGKALGIQIPLLLPDPGASSSSSRRATVITATTLR